MYGYYQVDGLLLRYLCFDKCMNDYDHEINEDFPSRGVARVFISL